MKKSNGRFKLLFSIDVIRRLHLPRHDRLPYRACSDETGNIDWLNSHECV